MTKSSKAPKCGWVRIENFRGFKEPQHLLTVLYSIPKLYANQFVRVEIRIAEKKGRKRD